MEYPGYRVFPLAAGTGDEMNIKRIILMQGGVETLDYFSGQLGASFAAAGVAVFLYDLRDPVRSTKHVRKFLKTGETALLTFNFEGLEREEELFSLRDGYLWQQYGIPCFNVCVDHPYWYENRFAGLLEDEEHHPGTLALYHHLSIDRNHEKYLREYYPEFKSAGFLPLAGTAFCPDTPQKSFAGRGTTLLFTGHYTELPFFDASIHAINEEYAAFYMSIIDELLRHPDRTVEEVAIRRVREETGSESVKELRLVLYKMLFIDLYVRNYFRGKAIQTLCDAGFPVTVIGKGWEKLPLQHPEKLTICPRTDSAGCLAALNEAKASLNVLPWFKDGAHDRVFNSILNGALCLSDPSRYLLEELPDGCGVRYYTLEHMETSLPELAEQVLSDPDGSKRCISAGERIVSERHTWEARFRQFRDILNSCGA